MRMPKETLVEERVDPRADVIAAPPLVRGLPVLAVPRLPIAIPPIAPPAVPDLRALPARIARATIAGTLGFMRENGLGPLAGLLTRAPLIGWALALQMAISGLFGVLMFGVEPMLVSALAFVLAMLVLNGAAARLDRENERGGET